MSSEAPAGLILIVVGSSLRAERMDRPLAYYLKQQIEAVLVDRFDDEADRPEVLVIADFRWLNDEELQGLPTISVGGPGVNGLAHQWLQELPLSLAVDDQFYIQMDPELSELKAGVWGMSNETTQIAVSAFLGRFLPRFLDAVDQKSDDD